MRIPDFVSGLLMLVVASIALIMALDFPKPIGQSLGPSTFPIAISSGLALGGVLLVAGSIRRRFASGKLATDEPEPTQPFNIATLLVMSVVIAAPIFYVLMIGRLGFLVTAFIMMFTATYVLWSGAMRVALFSLVSIIFIDGVFRGLFGIPLERGLLYIPWW